MATQSFWPIAVRLLPLLGLTEERYQSALINYGDGIVALGLTFVIALAIFVLIALQPYASKLYKDRKQARSREERRSATNYSWMILNYASLPIVAITAEIAVRDLNISALAGMLFIAIPLLAAYHCWMLTPRWPFAALLILMAALLFTVPSLLMPQLLALEDIGNALLTTIFQITILISIIYNTSWFAIIGSRLPDRNFHSSGSNSEHSKSKSRIFARWVMRDSLLIFLEFTLTLVLLFLLDLLVALFACSTMALLSL